MPRMKFEDDDFDEKELDVPYDGPQFERYRGDIPKTGTVLTARVTKGWWLVNEDGEQQTKLIVVAEQNNGSLAEFNGLPTWETLTWETRASGRYMPFLMNFGLTTRDVKRKLFVDDKDDNIGTPIQSIGGLEIGSDDFLCQIVIFRDWYDQGRGQGEWRSKIDWDGWLPYAEADGHADDDDEEEEDERPPARRSRTTRAQARGAKAAGATGRRRGDPDEDEDEDEEYDDDVADEEDDDVDDYDEDEDDEEPDERPTRGKSRQSQSATRSRTTRQSSGRSSGASVSSGRNASPGRRSSASTSRRSNASAGTRRTSTRTSSRRANEAAARDKADGGSSDEPPF